MKIHFPLVIALGLCVCTIISCKKENAASGTKAVFSYVVDGFNVNFTNFSTNAKQNSWDFGDGSDTSTLTNPAHIFHEKGPYLVSLTIRNGSETSTFIDTVLVTGPNIKIDGDFADWEHVDYALVNPDSSGGTITSLKTFASAENINFYIEGTADMNFAVLDLYIDADNNPATGFSTWFYPVGSGADFLCEGNFNNDNPNLTPGSVLSHAGAPADFSWEPVYDFADVMKFSKMSDVNGKKVFEFSIQRKALGTIKDYINFGLLDNNASFIQVGSIPVSQMSTSKFISVKL